MTTRKRKQSLEYHEAMLHTLELAADSIEASRFGGAFTREEAELHRLAVIEVTRRLRRMAEQYRVRHCIPSGVVLKANQ
jgi:UV DNA damage repair endonuclease